MSEETALVKHESSLMLTPVMDVALAKSRLSKFQEFIGGYLTESSDGGEDGGDYGVIPGTKKKTLLKSGSEKLCEVYGLSDDYLIESKIEDFTSGLFYYQIKCVLRSRRDDSIVGTGMGSCSSYESKYRWRDSQRKCPNCEKENIRKSKPKPNGESAGWYCWVKTGGCGATFKDGDQSIESQVIGRVENPDIIDIVNTVLKIAKKRSKIDAVISVTRSSGIFTQDLDDLPAQTKNITPEPSSDLTAGFNVGLSTPLRKITEKDVETTIQVAVLDPSQIASKSRQNATERDPFGPGVSEVVQKGKGQWLASWNVEMDKKRAELKEIMALPCFTDDQRTVMADNAARVQTLESMNKLVAKAMDHARKNAKAQSKADKEAKLKKQLEISQADYEADRGDSSKIREITGQEEIYER